MNIMNLSATIAIVISFLKVSNSENSSKNDDFDQREIVGECGGIFTEKQFFLQSPKYPKNYSSNLDCDYFLKGPECAAQYKIDFLHFHLENSVGCIKDRLEIEDQDALCGRKNTSKTYFAKNGSLHLKLKSDSNSSGKGFKIFITRMDCEKKSIQSEQTTTRKSNEANKTQLIPESTTLPFVLHNMPNLVPQQSECCSNTYNSKRFLLTSPDFPYSLNKKTRCSIQIQKANDNICRIRMNFLFFWLGTTFYNNCPYGSLEIDGKYICGCNKHLKLTTTFGGNNLKTLVFKSEGINLNFPSGFVLEITQDECPKKYYPQSPNKQRNFSQLFRFDNDQSIVASWPTEATIEKLQLVNEITDIVEDDGKNYFRNLPRIVKSVYFFAAPDHYPFPTSPQDIETTTFIDTGSLKSIVTNLNQFQCNNWNQMQFNLLNGRYGKSLQTCKREEESQNKRKGEGNRKSHNCVELDYFAGYFKSPGYPYYYPAGLNVCYRFMKQPGYCSIRVFMVDFKIENSLGCRMDYLLLENNNKFCGKTLFGQFMTFDLTNKDHEDIRFVTDSFRCGRGFSGVYQQIACQQPEHPINPVKPTTPVIPVIPTHSTEPPICDRFVREKEFVLEVMGDEEMCNFQIRKFSEDVCKINLYFEKFDLVCSIQSLTTDGMMFCGHLSGRKVSINLEGDEIKQVIYRNTLKNDQNNIRLRIIGQQITDDCLYPDPEVEPQRLTKVNSISFKNISARNITKHKDSSEYFIEMHNNHLKEICGIVTKSDFLPENFCDILKHFHNATRCTILDNNYSYLPNQKYKLDLVNEGSIMAIEYEEVDCGSND